jgi:hypothetical protein
LIIAALVLSTRALILTASAGMNGYPAKQRNHTVGFLFVPFEEKQNFECTSCHKLIFQVTKLLTFFLNEFYTT